MRASHTIPVMKPGAARDSLRPPASFECDGCSCFPDHLYSWRTGWFSLADICEIHDWHYAILRKHRGLWRQNDLDEFRAWADACFQMRLVYRLREHYSRLWADTLARGMWSAVRIFGGSSTR